MKANKFIISTMNHVDGVINNMKLPKNKHKAHTNSGMPHDFMIHFTIDNYIHLHTKTIYRSVV